MLRMRNAVIFSPRMRVLHSWFLSLAVAALCACSEPAVKSVPEYRPDGSETTISDARKNSHLAAGVVKQTVLDFKQGKAADKTDAKMTHLPYANPDAPKGGTLSMAAKGSFNSLNSFIDQGVAATGTFYLYDTLMTSSLDVDGALYPQLAEAVSFHPDDHRWVIYHIHPKARFWDGSAVTAADVKATFEAILRDGLMSWRAFLGGIEHIEAIDPLTVKFYFTDGAPQSLAQTVGLMPIFAKKDIEARFTQPSLEPLMGSGAYQLALAEPSRRVVYRRDANYWGAQLLANRGRFNFDEIEFRYYQDEAAAFEAFKLGQYRLHIESDIKRWATFSPSDQIIKQSLGNQNPVLMRGLVMNLRRPLFADIRVRRALNLAFDFEWINRQLLYGEYTRLNSYFYGSALQATGVPTPDEKQVLLQLPLSKNEQSALIGVPSQPVSDGSGYNRNNLLAARQLLLEAGFSYRQGQLVDKQGKIVHLEILVADDKYQPILLAYLNNLKRLGIQARIRRVDNASYIEQKRRFAFDMIIDEFMQGNSPAGEQLFLWGSKAAQEAGNQNTIGVQSAAIDAVIDKLIHAQTQSQTVLYTKVLDRLLLSGEYMIPWYGKAATDIAYWQGFHHADRTPTASIGLDYWWYEPPNKTKSMR